MDDSGIMRVRIAVDDEAKCGLCQGVGYINPKRLHGKPPLLEVTECPACGGTGEQDDY